MWLYLFHDIVTNSETISKLNLVDLFPRDEQMVGGDDASKYTRVKTPNSTSPSFENWPDCVPVLCVLCLCFCVEHGT